MIQELTRNVKTILCKTAVAAGTTDITDATAVDMQGYEGVRFIFSFGAITGSAVTSVGAAAKATSSPTVGTDDLEGSKIAVADDADDKIVILEINRPALRYIRPFVDRGTQNAVLNCIVAELYGAKVMPVAKDATVHAQEIHDSPAVGTA